LKDRLRSKRGEGGRLSGRKDGRDGGRVEEGKMGGKMEKGGKKRRLKRTEMGRKPSDPETSQCPRYAFGSR
jgi:hypothetical protein